MDLKRLRRLAREADDQHRAAMRAVQGDVDAAAQPDAGSPDSRRSFLRGLGLGGTALTVGSAAVALSAPTAGAQATTTTPAPGEATTTVAATTTTTVPKQPTTEDLVILVFAQSLELAMVEIYGAAIAGGKVGEEVLPVVTAFRDHHLQHGQAYAGLAGKAALNRANVGLVDEFLPRIEGAADEAAVLTILFELEDAAASSYTGALGEVEGLTAATTMANILPIESRHAVVLGEALGLALDEYVPSFEDPEKGFDPDQYPVIER